MELSTFQYKPQKGWTVGRFPDWDSDNTLVLIFASPACCNNPEPIQELASFYQKAKIAGCSSAGEIFQDSLEDESLSVAVVRFENTEIRQAQADVSRAKQSFQAGEQIAEQLNDPQLLALFVLSDGLHVNGSELVKGLNSRVSEGVAITGGLAGDGSDFKQSWTIFDGRVESNKVVCIGFYGTHFHLGYGFKGGWDLFGPLRRVSRSKGNILYSLDDKPALDLYKEYLGEKAADLPSSGLLYPLAIQDSQANEPRQLVRTILGIDEEAHALIFAGDIPEGWYAQLMRANFDRLIDSANEAGTLCLDRMVSRDHQGMGGPRYCDSSAGRCVCNNGSYSACYCDRHAVMDLQLLKGCCQWQGGVLSAEGNVVRCNNGSVSEICSLAIPKQEYASW